MGNLTIATIFIVMLNVLMWFSGIAMLEINPTGSICYNLEGSIIEQNINSYNGNINQSTLNNDIVSQLPSAQGTVSAGTSTNVFTDIFNSVLSWFKTAPGIKYIYGVVAAPYNILKCTGLPNAFIIGVGTLWYLISFLIFIAFLWGRD